MNRSGEPMRTGRRTSNDRKKCQPTSRRSRSPRKERQQRGSSPHLDATPRPLSFAVFVGNKPMTEADSIISDPGVAVEFARQIFSLEVQQSMVGCQDFEVFREGIHGAVKGLYTAYEVGMRLRAVRREIEKKDERNHNLMVHTKKAERELRELRSALSTEPWAASQSNLVMEERVTQQLLGHAIACRNTASMSAVENARASDYAKGFQDSQKVGVKKTRHVTTPKCV